MENSLSESRLLARSPEGLTSAHHRQTTSEEENCRKEWMRAEGRGSSPVPAATSSWNWMSGVSLAYDLAELASTFCISGVAHS